jgi:hypothetical protein
VLLLAPPLITQKVLYANLCAFGLHCTIIDNCASLIESIQGGAADIVVVDTLVTNQEEENQLQNLVK